MIGFRATWVGLDGIGEEELAKLRAPIERALLKAALHFEAAVKLKLTGARTGRIYRIGRKGRTYQASAPGEPPAALTGKLRQSITHTMPEWDGDAASAEVGTNLVYSAILEYGGVTHNGGRILPRPYIASTWLEEEDRMNAILDEAVRS